MHSFVGLDIIIIILFLSMFQYKQILTNITEEGQREKQRDRERVGADEAHFQARYFTESV